MNKKILLPISIIILCVVLMSMLPSEKKEGFRQKGFDIHNPHIMRPPVDSAILLASSFYCKGCHGHDPNQRAFITSNGVDVNINDRWKVSMMALSARDPFWRAKVSHEITVNPNHAVALENKCTSCHAPLGNYTHRLRNLGHYSINDLNNDTIGIDGVSCMSCHAQSPIGIGLGNSGELNFDTSRVAFGPYPLPFAAPMTDFVHITPQFSPHILDAGVCAACHTLLTETVDLSGNFTGTKFVEQATYHEWLNSAYNETKEKTRCQDCHMPQLNDGIQIATDYPITEYRAPFAVHEFAGANTMMLKLIKNNKTALGINASDENFDTVITATMHQLQQKAIDMQLLNIRNENDTAFFDVSLLNKTGHKFPSGYPSRRAYVEFTVQNSNGDVLFQSGKLQPDYEVEGHDATFEPHYNVISQNDQVQIYEMVMYDVNQNVTTILERADIQAKDNRIPPIGFTTTHRTYDTVRIYGVNNDSDFNLQNGFEGSGKDIVHYQIPMHGYVGQISVTAKLYYQSLPPKWLQEMFSMSTTPIETFRTMYNNADKSPVLVASQALNLTITGLNETFINNQNINIIRNQNNTFTIKGLESSQIKSLKIFDANGKLVKSQDNNHINFYITGAKGIYFVKIETNKGICTKKIVL